MNTELTVNDYLDNLELDRQDMINSLKSKGVELSDSVTFTELVPKIDGLVDINGYYDLTKQSSGRITKYIKQIPMIDTSEYTSMNNMFDSYSSLITIPQLDTSNVTDMRQMFIHCTSLTTIPQLDTSNVTTMYWMFTDCPSLTIIPLLNTSKVTDMGGMLQNCPSLTIIPLLDTSNVTNMNSMFQNCQSLTTIPQLNTSNVTNMSYMFQGCKSLTSIPILNCEKVTSVNSMIDTMYVDNNKYLTTLGGFTNLGKAYSTTESANYWTYKLDLSYARNLTHDSLMNIINNLYDIATKGCQPQSLYLGSTNLAKLTEEEIAIATNKGWTVS